MLETRRITRRKVVLRTTARDSEKVQKQLDELLQSIAKLQLEVDEATQRKVDFEKQVEKLMRGYKIPKHEWGELVAQIVDTFSRTSKEVDPQKLYNKLNEKDFFSCVKVQLTELAKIMSEKEIEAIATIEHSKKTGDKFEIVRPKKKVSKK